MDSFSTRIKMLREQRDLNQAELAPLVGSTRSSFSTYENGLTPPVNVVVECAKFFDVSTDYLLGLTDEKRPKASDELSKKLDKLSQLCGKHALSNSDISELLDAMIKYYRAGAKADHAPADALNEFLNSMTDLFLFAAGDDLAALLSSVNNTTRTALKISDVLNVYLTNTKLEPNT